MNHRKTVKIQPNLCRISSREVYEETNLKMRCDAFYHKQITLHNKCGRDKTAFIGHLTVFHLCVQVFFSIFSMDFHWKSTDMLRDDVLCDW